MYIVYRLFEDRLIQLYVAFEGHTRTSLLRTLNSSGHFSSDEWLMPETRQLFEKQAQRQKQLAIGIINMYYFTVCFSTSRPLRVF